MTYKNALIWIIYHRVGDGKNLKNSYLQRIGMTWFLPNLIHHQCQIILKRPIPVLFRKKVAIRARVKRHYKPGCLNNFGGHCINYKILQKPMHTLLNEKKMGHELRQLTFIPKAFSKIQHVSNPVSFFLSVRCVTFGVTDQPFNKGVSRFTDTVKANIKWTLCSSINHHLLINYSLLPIFFQQHECTGRIDLIKQSKIVKLVCFS